MGKNAFLTRNSHLIMEWYSHMSYYSENVRYFLYLFCIYPRICVCFVVHSFKTSVLEKDSYK